MILPIYLYGQPVLKKVAEDINAEYPNLEELIENMFDTNFGVKVQVKDKKGEICVPNNITLGQAARGEYEK